jgi:hypothetical protein
VQRLPAGLQGLSHNGAGPAQGIGCMANPLEQPVITAAQVSMHVPDRRGFSVVARL